MKPPVPYRDPTPSENDTRLAWLIAVATSGLVIVAAALALDLHNQKRRLEDVSAQLKETLTLRETESRTASARSATGEAALQRVRELTSEQESDLKKLGELYAQREPVVKQSIEVQDKFTSLVTDLLEIAKIDPDAKEIVRKYNIQH